MEVPAGDEHTSTLLLSRYKATGCLHCKQVLEKTRTDHTHLTCPNRPCYLCKKHGHLSNVCPYRALPNAHKSAMKNLSLTRERRARTFHFLRARETEVHSERVNPAILQFRNPQFDGKAAFIGRKLHEKRVTAIEWLPGDETKIISGDKAGVVRLWNIGQSLSNGYLEVDAIPKQSATTNHVHYLNINQFALNAANPDVVYTSSSDGVVCAVTLSRMASGEFDTLQNLNPDGWQGKMSTFKMLYGLRYHNERRCLFAGVSDGTILRFDPREDKKPGVSARFHKDKVTCIDINPVSPDLLVTASNDKEARLWDARKFIPGQEIGSYTHGRVVSAAYFSPNTGSKLLTTSLDNRLQVWNDLHAFQGDVNEYVDSAPIEVVHSHDFHRHLNPFRAIWDPKDWKDDLFLCGRFLGDAYYDEGESGSATVLHPIDMFSAKTGTLVHSMMDSGMPLMCPINKFAPNSDCILTAASRDLVLWSPPPRGFRSEDGVKRTAGRSGRGGGGDDDDANGGDDDDGDDAQPRKRKRAAKPRVSARPSKRRVAS